MNLAKDVRHKIQYYRILLSLAHKADEENVETTLSNKVIMFEMLLRIDGFE